MNQIEFETAIELSDKIDRARNRMIAYVKSLLTYAGLEPKGFYCISQVYRWRDSLAVVVTGPELLDTIYIPVTRDEDNYQEQ